MTWKLVMEILFMVGFAVLAFRITAYADGAWLRRRWERRAMLLTALYREDKSRWSVDSITTRYVRTADGVLVFKAHSPYCAKSIPFYGEDAVRRAVLHAEWQNTKLGKWP